MTEGKGPLAACPSRRTSRHMPTANSSPLPRRPLLGLIALVSVVLLLATVGLCLHAWSLSAQGVSGGAAASSATAAAGRFEPYYAWRTTPDASKVRVVEATRRGISIESRQFARPPKDWPAASV